MNRPLTPVDLEAEKIARYDLVTYECGLGHRTCFLLDESKARPLSRDEIKQDGWTRQQVCETHDKEIIKELYELARELEKMEREGNGQ